LTDKAGSTFCFRVSSAGIVIFLKLPATGFNYGSDLHKSIKLDQNVYSRLRENLSFIFSFGLGVSSEESVF
jgi:hypothetical protein